MASSQNNINNQEFPTGSGSGIFNVSNTINIPTTNTGISFDGGTNILSYYNAGTFTPAFSGATGVTYSTQSGYYSIFNGWGTVAIQITLSAITSSSSQVIIDSFPTYSPGIFIPIGAVGIAYQNVAITAGTDAAIIAAWGSGTNNQLYLWYYFISKTTNAPQAVPYSALSNTSSLYISYSGKIGNF